jgi:hypothetical protein
VTDRVDGLALLVAHPHRDGKVVKVELEDDRRPVAPRFAHVPSRKPHRGQRGAASQQSRVVKQPGHRQSRGGSHAKFTEHMLTRSETPVLDWVLRLVYGVGPVLARDSLA